MIKLTSQEPLGFSSRNESCCRWPWREDAQFHSQTTRKANPTPSTDKCRYPTAKTILLVVLPHVSYFVLISYCGYFANTEYAYSGSGWTSPSWRCVTSRCDWLKWRTGAWERTNGVWVLLDEDVYVLYNTYILCNHVYYNVQYTAEQRTAGQHRRYINRIIIAWVVH